MNCLSIIIQQIYFYRIQINHYTFFQSIDLLTQVPIKNIASVKRISFRVRKPVVHEFLKKII